MPSPLPFAVAHFAAHRTVDWTPQSEVFPMEKKEEKNHLHTVKPKMTKKYRIAVLTCSMLFIFGYSSPKNGHANKTQWEWREFAGRPQRTATRLENNEDGKRQTRCAVSCCSPRCQRCSRREPLIIRFGCRRMKDDSSWNEEWKQEI